MAYVFRGNPDPTPPSPKCGTNAGYMEHCREKTEKCQPCKDAHAEALQKWRKRPSKAVVRIQCGTYPGYMRHKRAGEEPCELCLIGYAYYMRGYRARKRTVGQAA